EHRGDRKANARGTGWVCGGDEGGASVNAPSAEGIFRAMVEENGMPKLGAAAILLGIRIGVDIAPDAAGEVHRPAFRPSEKNGLSCAATIESLPRFSLP